MVNALLQDDALLGKDLDDDGLVKLRGSIRGIANPAGVDSQIDNSEFTDIPTLFNGDLLMDTGDENNPFGLREAPLG